MAINTAQAAQRAAKPVQTPRLQSVLLAREALGHARTGDARRTWQALRKADGLAGRERHDNDPPWLEFWGAADLAWHRMLAAIDLDVLPVAEEAARDALGSVDAITYPRNHSLYSAHLADILVTRRALDEAVPVTARAITSASEIDSGRLHAQVQAVLHKLAAHRSNAAVRELLDWAPTVLRPSPVPA